MIDNGFPLLSACLAWPLIGALMVMFIRNRAHARIAALSISLAELALTIAVAVLFDSENGGFQFTEDAAWIPSLNVRYQLGIDGISVLFLPITALLTSMSILAGWNSVQRLQHFHLALLLTLESITIGVFTALDLALFFLFWELTLPPLFFLIGLWGVGARRREAAMKYVLYMLFGGVPLLFGIILLAFNYAELHGGLPQGLSFSLPTLINSGVPSASQDSIFLLLLIGFAVKAPLVPLHTWLPTTAMEAPPQIAALLLGLKLGVYGLIRFAIPLTPAAAQDNRWLLGILGAITLVYGALLALQQSNLRRLLAYAGISHVGLVVMGIASFNIQGMQGAVMQLLNFGIVAGSLMLIAGMLQQRLGSNELLHLGGLAKPLPRLTTLFFLFALSSIGVPGLNAFPAELLLILGALEAYPTLAVTALFAAILAAAYMLIFMRNAFLGPIKQLDVTKASDLIGREMVILLLPALLAVLLGIAPQWLLSIQEVTLQRWLQQQHTPVLLRADTKCLTQRFIAEA